MLKLTKNIASAFAATNVPTANRQESSNDDKIQLSSLIKSVPISTASYNIHHYNPVTSMPQLSTNIGPERNIFDSSHNRSNSGNQLANRAEHDSAVGPNIYFSSTASEPIVGTTRTALPYQHKIRRAPDASRSHPNANVERFCLPKPKIYRVLYPYKPQQPDELELQYGDLLAVTIQCDDGWFLGRSTLTGKFGTFPGNYVEPV